MSCVKMFYETRVCADSSIQAIATASVNDPYTIGRSVA
jgi:hypothetical protein